MTQPLLVLQPLNLVRPLFILEGRDSALVVGSEALVIVVRRTIPLEVSDGYDRPVDWELLVVHPKTVTVGIGVGEQTGLQDRICRWLDTGNKMRRRESRLLDLSEVVLGVLVENNLPKRTKGELSVRPDLGEVKDVVAEFFSLFWSHSLLRV